MKPLAQLLKANYKIVWKDGADFRGIDCALLYNPDVFTLESADFLNVKSKTDADFSTREIVYVKGKIGRERFHVFVNHWPSRRGGAEASEPKRILAANVVRKKVNEIFDLNEFANIIMLKQINIAVG